MNHCVSHWNMADERSHFSDHLSGSSQKKSTGPNPELLELLWRNGQVVMNSQTHRKPTSAPNESKPFHRPEHPLKLGGSSINSSNLIQEDETASWLQYPLEDSLEKDFCSDFFYDIPTVDAIKENPTEDVRLRSQPFFKQCSDLRFTENNIPPPELQGTDAAVVRRSNLGSGRVVNFSHFSRLFKAGEEGKGAQVQGEMGESSVMTVGSSHCGSNQVQYQANLSPVSNIFPVPVKEGVQRVVSQRERGCTDTVEPTTTLSSGGSGGSLGRTGKQTSSNQSHKRKSRDGDASECQSEDAEYESVEASKPAPRSASARRRRAAEVHNLSERRRRDRINEKMRELQELIPHCNKSDKASMLDEAIEYLKSLQMQVQIMWMGSGMAPMMYPSMQHYMSRMSMGMGAAPVPPVHGHLQLPRVSLVNQSMPSQTPNQPTVGPSPVLNAHNFQNQVQSLNLPEPYARFFGFHPMQMSQAMNLFPYGSQQIQPIPNQRIAQPTSLEGACNGGVLSDNVQAGNLG